MSAVENFPHRPFRFADIGGLRLIVWVSIAAMLVGVTCFWRLRRRNVSNADDLYRDAAATAAGTATARTPAPR